MSVRKASSWGVPGLRRSSRETVRRRHGQVLAKYAVGSTCRAGRETGPKVPKRVGEPLRLAEDWVGAADVVGWGSEV